MSKYKIEILLRPLYCFFRKFIKLLVPFKTLSKSFFLLYGYLVYYTTYREGVFGLRVQMQGSTGFYTLLFF